MKNIWQEMYEEAEDIIRSSHCEKCLGDYEKGRRSALLEFAPRIHEMNLALMQEIAMRDDKINALRAKSDAR